LAPERKIIYFLLCCGIVTINFNFAAIAAVIPTISLDLNLPDFQVSRIITYYLIPYGFGALIFAPLTKYVTYRNTLAGSLFIYSLASLFCGLSQGLDQLAIGNVLAGISAAGAIPLGLMIIGELFEKEIRGRLVGLFFSASFIAALTGLFVSGIAHWRWLFFTPAIIGLLSAIALLVLPTGLLNRKHEAPVNYLKVITDLRIRNFFVFIVIMSFLYHGIHKWYGVYLAKEYHLDKFAISVFIMVTSLFGAAGQNVGGFLTDKRGRLAACFTGGMILGVATMLLAGHYPLFILAAVLAGISVGWTISHNSISTVLTDFPEDDRPMLASLNSSLRFVSGGLGFWLSSFSVQKSFSFTFLAIGILVLLTSFSLNKLVSEQ
jgi:predicted MFS family arabinose efflux permease